MCNISISSTLIFSYLLVRQGAELLPEWYPRETIVIWTIQMCKKSALFEMLKTMLKILFISFSGSGNNPHASVLLTLSIFNRLSRVRKQTKSKNALLSDYNRSFFPKFRQSTLWMFTNSITKQHMVIVIVSPRSQTHVGSRREKYLYIK